MGIFSLFKNAETLYFPGCNAYYKNKIYFEIYKKIFSKLGIEVKTLQKFLNSNNYIITTKGEGSPGKETNKFGALTKKALIKFQKAKGLLQTGLLDDKTIRMIEKVSAEKAFKDSALPNTSVQPVQKEVSITYSAVFNKDLKKNDVSTDVKSLQIFLNNHGFVIASKGVGSPGKENKSFGELTKKALMKFQKSVGIPATGILGPKTRAYINDIQ